MVTTLLCLSELNRKVEHLHSQQTNTELPDLKNLLDKLNLLEL
jgi:hypothetical protein